MPYLNQSNRGRVCIWTLSGIVLAACGGGGGGGGVQVAGPPDRRATGMPVISHDGTPQTTEDLRADVGGIRDPDDISPNFRYAWYDAAHRKVSTDDETGTFTPSGPGEYYVKVTVIDDASHPGHARSTILTSAPITVTPDNGAPDFPPLHSVAETRRAGDVISYFMRATDPDADDLIEFAFPDSGMIQDGDITYDNGNGNVTTIAGYGTAPVGTVIGTLEIADNTAATTPKTARLVFTPNADAFSHLEEGDSETFTIRIEARDDDPASPHTHQDFGFTVARYPAVQLRHSFSGVPDSSHTLTTANTVTTITLAEQTGLRVIKSGNLRAFVPDGEGGLEVFRGGTFGGGNSVVYLDVNGNGILDEGIDTVHTTSPGGNYIFSSGRWQYGLNEPDIIGTGNDLIHVTPAGFNPDPGQPYAPPVAEVMLTFIIERGDAIVDEGASHIITDLGGSAGVTFTITDLPDNGRLLNGVVVLGAGGTFTQSDIDDGDISYEHDGGETIVDGFAFSRSDSTTGEFDFVIAKVNDLPVITGDLAATLDEGGTYTLTLADVSATDADNSPDDFFYRITKAPENGTLMRGDRAARFFTVADIREGSVTYEHDGSDTLADTFGFALGDGIGSVEAEFAFTITPVDDL